MLFFSFEYIYSYIRGITFTQLLFITYLETHSKTNKLASSLTSSTLTTTSGGTTPKCLFRRAQPVDDISRHERSHFIFRLCPRLSHTNTTGSWDNPLRAAAAMTRGRGWSQRSTASLSQQPRKKPKPTWIDKQPPLFFCLLFLFFLSARRRKILPADQ